jgi:kynurenine formamidase
MMELPTYHELPLNADGVRSAWHLFGANDSVGMMNLLTPEKVTAALSTVREGAVLPLNLPVDYFQPPLYQRSPMRHEKILTRGGQGMEEIFDGFNTQASSQWDSLAHVAYAADTFYNGATLEDVQHGGRNTIDHWARRGIVTRAVLLDMQRTAEAEGWAYDPGSAKAFTPEELERARIRSGVEYEPGDVIVIRTGFTQWYAGLDADERRRVSTHRTLEAAGVEHTEAMAEYLWNTHAAAIASDAPSVEVWPTDHAPELYPYGLLHQMILAQFGMGLGELWFLEDLAEGCAADGRYVFALASAPLLLDGAVASPANALAIR